MDEDSLSSRDDGGAIGSREDPIIIDDDDDDDESLGGVVAQAVSRPQRQQPDDDEDEGAELCTYVPFKPTLRLACQGREHASSVAETAALAAVAPPDRGVALHIPHSLVTTGALSQPQLEAVGLAAQQFKTCLPDGARRGFLIADGTGVGKGRMLSGVYLNHIRTAHLETAARESAPHAAPSPNEHGDMTRVCVWLSSSAELADDAARDLNDIGTSVPLYTLGALSKQGPIKYATAAALHKARVHATADRDDEAPRLNEIDYDAALDAKGRHAGGSSDVYNPSLHQHGATTPAGTAGARRKAAGGGGSDSDSIMFDSGSYSAPDSDSIMFDSGSYSAPDSDSIMFDSGSYSAPDSDSIMFDSGSYSAPDSDSIVFDSDRDSTPDSDGDSEGGADAIAGGHAPGGGSRAPGGGVSNPFSGLVVAGRGVSGGSGLRRGAVLFGTYNWLVRGASDPIGRLVEFLGDDWDGVLIFDEVHKGKEFDVDAVALPGMNPKAVGSHTGSKTAAKIVELQLRLPRARVVYASATGASSASHLGVLVRLGLFRTFAHGGRTVGTGSEPAAVGRSSSSSASSSASSSPSPSAPSSSLVMIPCPFESFLEFQSAIDAGGMAALELCAVDMKRLGMFVSRKLSFTDVTYETASIPVGAELAREWDKAAALWRVMLQLLLRDAPEMASRGAQFPSRKIEHAAFARGVSPRRVTGTGERVPPWLYNAWRLYRPRGEDASEGDRKGRDAAKAALARAVYGAHQRWAMEMLLCAKVPGIVWIAAEALRRGMSVVIGLQSTGEASADRAAAAQSASADYDGNALHACEGGSEQQQHEEGEEEEDEVPADTESVRSCGSAAPAAAAPASSSFGSGARRGGLHSTAQSIMYHVVAERFPLPPVPFSLLQGWGNEQLAAAGASSGSDGDHGGDGDDDDDDDGVELVGDSADDSACAHYETACLMRWTLLRSIEDLRLPPNALDHLIDKLHGPKHVAELTGRAHCMVRDADQRGPLQREDVASSSSAAAVRVELASPMQSPSGGPASAAAPPLPCFTMDDYAPLQSDVTFTRRTRSSGDNARVNLAEREAFQSGRKRVAIISEAASTGVSLHADRGAKNTRRRAHITAQLPWSAMQMNQQFGRTCRANQVRAPHYVLAMTDVAGESRYAATIASRLEQLGALTDGDRRAKSANDLSRYSFDGVPGQEALSAMYGRLFDGSGKPPAIDSAVLATVQPSVAIAAPAAAAATNEAGAGTAGDARALLECAARGWLVDCGVAQARGGSVAGDAAGAAAWWVDSLQRAGAPGAAAAARMAALCASTAATSSASSSSASSSSASSSSWEASSAGSVMLPPIMCKSAGGVWTGPLAIGARASRQLVLTGKDQTAIKRRTDFSFFANRLNMLPLGAQNSLFAYFLAHFATQVRELRAAGRLDSGIVSLKGSLAQVGGGGSSSSSTSSSSTRSHASSGGATEVLASLDLPGADPSSPVRHELRFSEFVVDKGLPWHAAVALLGAHREATGGSAADVASATGARAAAAEAGIAGFWLLDGDKARTARAWDRVVHLAIPETMHVMRSLSRRVSTTLTVYRPEIGLVAHATDARMTPAELRANYRKLSDEEAPGIWEDAYKRSEKRCRHYMCEDENCQVGRRVQRYYVLSGTLLPYWPLVMQLAKQHAPKVVTPDGITLPPRPKLRVVHIEHASETEAGAGAGAALSTGVGAGAALSTGAGVASRASEGAPRVELGLSLPVKYGDKVVAGLRANLGVVTRGPSEWWRASASGGGASSSRGGLPRGVARAKQAAAAASSSSSSSAAAAAAARQQPGAASSDSEDDDSSRVAAGPPKPVGGAVKRRRVEERDDDSAPSPASSHGRRDDVDEDRGFKRKRKGRR